MGFRFGRSFRLGKSARINVSRRGLGASFGGKGLRLGLGPRGGRFTARIPGTGISYAKGLGGFGCLFAPIIFVATLPVLLVVALARLASGRPRRAGEVKPQPDQESWNDLCERFGPDAARSIWARQLWVGAPSPAVTVMFGAPADVGNLPGGRGTVLKFFPDDRGAYRLRVFLENGAVTGWSNEPSF